MATRNIVLITGANSGIGLELAKLLFGSRQSYHVLLGARSAEKGAAAAKQLQAQFPSTSNSVEVAQIDVTKDESITQAFEKIKTEHGHIDFLVNNAGFCHNDDILKETSIREAWNDMYDTNVTGQHVVTETFAHLLIKSSDPRLLFVTSGTANVTRFSQEYWPGPPPAAGWPKPGSPIPLGYRMSKVAVNMLMLGWHWILKEDGVKVWAISPGMLATSLGGNTELLKKMGAGEPIEGAELMRKVLEGEKDGEVGTIVGQKGIQPW
ncbi:hypothetical protein CEP51_004364 [Fusarium floridanum]|uniref:Uncharacterized protein n=1 Tax=Fusarium floridanum TaxID=1325733 RepID=A0A428S1P3_9HYPO|nr:hypothetical protein CEP51_004364 [Fusarium floridanum]